MGIRALRLCSFLAISLLLITTTFSSGLSEEGLEGVSRNPSSSPPYKDHGVPAAAAMRTRTRTRKLLVMESLHDYEDVCANTKHNPRRTPGCKNKIN